MPPPVPERLAAKAAGTRTYSTGKPCKNGHFSDRYTSTGVCIACGEIKHKRFLERHPGLEAKWARERRAKDPTGHRAEVKRWRENNREKAYETLKRWKKANIEKVRRDAVAAMGRRRARVSNNGGSFTAADIEALYAKQDGQCAVCPATECLEIDHRLPIILGGSSDPSNLQLLCRPCNRSKGGKHPDAWSGRTS